MLRTLSGWFLKLSGWKKEGSAPLVHKFVMVAAPHTSNWDFFWMMWIMWSEGVRIHFLMKKQWFKGPVGWALLALRGVPVDRSSPQNLVASLVDNFNSRKTMVLAVPPEGTRARRDHWKSGFYRIAEAANVPIVLSALDYGAKRGVYGPVLRPSGDLKRDMDIVRAFYQDKVGRHPERFSTIRLREEGPMTDAEPVSTRS